MIKIMKIRNQSKKKKKKIHKAIHLTGDKVPKSFKKP